MPPEVEPARRRSYPPRTSRRERPPSEEVREERRVIQAGVHLSCGHTLGVADLHANDVCDDRVAAMPSPDAAHCTVGR
jgi:hypothetical protein